MPLLFTPLAELFSGAAFRPAFTDATRTLRERLPRMPVLFASLGTRSLRTSVLSFDGAETRVVQPPALVNRPDDQSLSAYLRSLAEACGPDRPRHAVVLLAHGWTAELSERPLPGSPLERLAWLRQQPERVLGKRPGADQIAVAVGHPTLPESVHFYLPLRLSTEAAEIVGRAGLQLVRLQVVHASILECLTFLPSAAPLGADLLIADAHSVLFLATADGRWSRLRFASNRPSELATDVARFLRDRPTPSAPLIVAGDPALVPLVRQLAPEAALAQPLPEALPAEFHAASAH